MSGKSLPLTRSTLLQSDNASCKMRSSRCNLWFEDKCRTEVSMRDLAYQRPSREAFRIVLAYRSRRIAASLLRDVQPRNRLYRVFSSLPFDSLYLRPVPPQRWSPLYRVPRRRSRYRVRNSRNSRVPKRSSLSRERDLQYFDASNDDRKEAYFNPVLGQQVMDADLERYLQKKRLIRKCLPADSIGKQNYCLLRCFDKLDQRSKRNAGRALRLVRADRVAPSCSGDVEMRPFCFVDKLLDEHCPHDGARLSARSNIFNIGNVGADLFTVFRSQRQLPKAFARFFAQIDDLVHQCLIITHDAGVLIAKSNDHGTGQRCHIDDPSCPLFFGVRDSIG